MGRQHLWPKQNAGADSGGEAEGAAGAAAQGLGEVVIGERWGERQESGDFRKVCGAVPLKAHTRGPKADARDRIFGGVPRS